MRFLATVLVAGFLSGAAHAGATFTTIDDPADPTFNQLLGINNDGTISGYFGSGAVGHPNKGYTITSPYTNFQSDNLPGSVQTQATGINSAGVTSGFWAPTNLGGGDANYGFIRWNKQIKGGKGKPKYTYFSINDPLGNATPPVGQVLGINDKNIAAGFYNDVVGASHGFVYTVSSGTFTPIEIKGASSVAATGINNANLVCGFFSDQDGSTEAFLEPIKGGSPITFTVPKSTVTQFLGVNVSGMAVGFFTGKDGVPHGILFNPANGKWVQIDAPLGAEGTILNGINDAGQIVGFYMDSVGNTHGVLIDGEAA